MLTIYAVVAITACFIFSLLAVIVYFINRKNLLNRIFIITIAFGAYSAFTSFMVLQADNTQTAQLWNKIGCLWPFFVPALLQFVLVFTENRLMRGIRNIVVSNILLYAPAMMFSMLDLLTNQISGVPVMSPGGYTFTGSSSLLYTASEWWSSTVALLSLLLCVRYYFAINEKNKKQQTKLVSFAIFFPIILSLLSKLSYYIIGTYVAYYGAGGNALLCIFIAYAIWKYDLFNINPSLAAENIIATIPDSFILTDPEGKILRINSALTDLLDYKENELQGKTINQLLCGKYNTQFIGDLIQNQDVKNLEAQMVTKKNTKKPVSISASLIKSKKGKNIGITLIIHDLTRRKQYEEKIIRNEHFAAIGELAGMVGHDLRNPLTSIQNATYYLKKKCGKNMDVTASEMFVNIEKSIQYADKIVNDLLDYSREIKLKTEETNVKTLLTGALALTPTPENSKIFDYTDDQTKIFVDTMSMNRVFTNIIKNAFDAMPNGGSLTIKSTQEENDVDISFEDTGEGMTEETIDKLWTPLFTTKAKGMGFGLPICKRIIEAHKGKISVKSVLGKGTTFTISLPKNPPKED